MTVGELWTYLGFFTTLVAAGLGFPAPEELVILTAGVLSGRMPVPPPQPLPEDVAALFAPAPDAGSLGGLPWTGLTRCSPPSPDPLPLVRWWIMLPVCIAGVVLADVILYTIGRFFGDWLLNRPWLARWLPASKRQRTEENFHRYGVGILVFGRLVPGIRAPLFLTAGSMRLPLPRFLLADGLGAIVGNSLFFFLGYWLGNSITELVVQAEEKAKPIVIVVGVGLLTAYLLWHFLRHPVSTGDPEEVPIIGPQVASHMECPEPPCPPPEPSENGMDEKTPPRAADKPKPEDRA